METVHCAPNWNCKVPSFSRLCQLECINTCLMSIMLYPSIADLLYFSEVCFRPAQNYSWLKWKRRSETLDCFVVDRQFWMIFTVRNEVCHSVHGGGGCLPQCMLGYTTPTGQTQECVCLSACWDTQPSLVRHGGGGCLPQCMLGYTHPWADTPWADTNQADTPRADTPLVVNAADGRHPTGMHSCLQYCFIITLYCNVYCKVMGGGSKIFLRWVPTPEVGVLTYFFGQKLHENERIWTPWAFPLDPPRIITPVAYY